MALTRRQVLTGAALTAVRAPAQPPGPGAAGQRPIPSVCLYSRVLAGIEYPELPMIVRSLGFDGCDLAVEPGGHVDPNQAGMDLMPALEAITGAGLEAAMISTPFTSIASPGARQALGLAGLIGVPLYRPGRWSFTVPGPQLRRDIAGLGALGRAANMAMAIQTGSGGPAGGTVQEIEPVIRGFDPRWVGFDFDPASAWLAGGAEGLKAAFQVAIPRLKSVTIRDFRKPEAAAQDAPGAGVSGAGVSSSQNAPAVACPLGSGTTDWSLFFSMLAKAGFAGPVSLRVDYRPESGPSAIRRDLEFVRKHLTDAYAAKSAPARA